MALSFQHNHTLLAGAEMLGSHEEKFSVLARHICKGREEVKAVMWLSGHVTTSKVLDRAMYPGACRPTTGREPSLLLLVSR